MTSALFGSGICICGHPFCVFRPEDSVTAQRISDKISNLVDVIIADGTMAHCSRCGKLLVLPPAERFDKDRSDLGQFLSTFD